MILEQVLHQRDDVAFLADPPLGDRRLAEGSRASVFPSWPALVGLGEWESSLHVSLSLSPTPPPAAAWPHGFRTVSGSASLETALTAQVHELSIR